MTALTKLTMFVGVVLPIWAQTIPQEAVAAHAQAAQAAERRNDFATAVREYEYVASQLPQSAEIVSNLGVALYFDSQLTAAVKAFRKAMVLDEKLLAPHLFSGLAWYRLSNPDAAVPELERAVHIDPSDVIAHTWLGYAYTAQSKYESALSEFHTAARLGPNDIDVWFALGDTYLQLGRAATLKLLTAAPDGARTWQLAGEQSELQGKHEEALENFRGALQRRPDIPELRTLDAGKEERTGTAPRQERGTTQEDEFYRQAHEAEQQARAAFERVIQIGPDSYRAHQIMADSLAAQQHDDEAMAEYRVVLKLKPDLPGIHEAIGNELLRSGRTAGALIEFEAEVQLQPRSASALAKVGEALLLEGNDEEARKALTDSLAMNRPPMEVHRLLAKLDLRAKRFRSAADSLNQYLSINKDDSTAYFLLAKAYQGLGDQQRMEHALGLYRKTSLDAKARGRAQRELQSFSNPNKAYETADAERNLGR